MCASMAAGASIIGGGAIVVNYRRILLTMRTAGCMPAVGAKIVENVVNAIEKSVPFTPKSS